MICRLATLVAALACGAEVSAQTPAQAEKFEKADAEVIAKLGTIWTGVLAKANEGKLVELAYRASDEAYLVGAKGPATEGFEAWSNTPAPFTSPTPLPPESLEILKAATAAAAAAVEPILALTPSDAQAARFAEHLQRALVADLKNAKYVALHRKRCLDAVSAKNWDAARAYVMRAFELDADGYRAGKYAAAEEALGKNGGIVVRGPDHLMQAYVVLPPGWTPKKTWPLIVAVAGANCIFQTQMQELVKVAGKKPYILMVPMTTCNANELPHAKLPYSKAVLARFEALEHKMQRCWWDERGLLSLLGEAQRRFSAAPKFCMTGYSGGGNLAYMWSLHHARDLVAVCFSSANYWTYFESNAEKPADGGCPILVVTGDKDEAGKARIFPQSDEGTAKLKELGFAQVERRHMPNRAHDPFYDFAVELFDAALVPAKKK